MRILELHIYGYGQLENVIIKDLADFQVFYGENEAGKSTIMAFIHGILFGFPTKQQTELRYEPMHSNKYGGKIRVYHEEHGFAVIERVKGKAAGDVNVVMDNGMMGGEELLKELVASFDKNLFQAVFSFSLHGLQNVHQMKGEDIGKFLFSAGTLGTERLSKTESFLQKELDNRFKPSGKKPIINEKLQALNEINLELKKAASKNKEYESLLEKREMLLQEFQEINGRLKELGSKIDQLHEWKRIESNVREEKWTEKELSDLGEVPFPTRGMERIEKLLELIHPYEAEINSLKERIENEKKELAEMRPKRALLESESALLTLLDQVPLMEQLTFEKQQSELKIAECDEKLSVIREKLHLPLEENDVFAINTNIYMRNQVEITSRKRQKLQEVKEELEERFQEETRVLQEIEKEVRMAESHLLAKQDREYLEKQLINGNDKQSLEADLKALKDKIEFYQLGYDRDKKEGANSRKQKKLQLFLFEGILLGLLFYGLLTKQWVLLFIGLIGCVLTAYFMTKGSKESKAEELQQTLVELKEKEKQLIEKLHSAEYMDLTKLEDQLKRDTVRLEEVQVLKMKLKQQQSLYDKVITKFEEWELEYAQNKEKLLSLSLELNIPEYIAVPFLLEAFELIEQYKTTSREKSQLQTKVEQINNQQAKLNKEMNKFASRFLPEQGLALQEIAYLLRNRLKEEHEKQIKSQERERKLAELAADVKQKEHEIEHLKAEYNKLLHAAGVETEQEFYEFGKMAEKQGKLFERLGTLKSQLEYSLLPRTIWETFLHIHNSDEIIAEYNHEVLHLQTRLKKQQEELAAIKYEIQVLEEGGVYSTILHNYKQKKYELEESAKEWAVYCIAQEILSNTVEKYKKVHVPRLISKAEEYLSFLTNGNYQKIHLQQSGTGFLVERMDRTIFEANELSQATTEQLYVSIRLALATTLYEKYQFPIIIDDSFVNFDAKRTRKVIELLQSLQTNQVLFFTCHEHLLHLFKKENILNITKGAVQIIS
ncbi:AAA family ATPase [Neobacillus rhizosphaerae]|uniref:AAA family ATPase n=1 Tax=Neobacillus rhizosphaerae TaxID=2880965 RepID=UPI003D2A4B1B